MVTLPTTAFLIGLHIAAGSMLLLPLVPIRHFGAGFFRMSAGIVLAILLTALYLMPTQTAVGKDVEFGTGATQAISVIYDGMAQLVLYGLAALLLARFIWLGG